MGFSFGASADPRKTKPTINIQPQPQANPLAGFGQLFQPQPTPPPIDFAALFKAMRPDDPQHDAGIGYVPGVMNQSNPFSNGFFNSSAASLSPEARQATQGNSAMTQWAKLGQVPGVDPAKLQNVMGQMTPTPAFNQPEMQTPVPQALGGLTPEVLAHITRLLYGGAGPARPGDPVNSIRY